MAGVTGDILAILDKIPVWKRVQETPDRVDALERRIAELETKLQRAPGLACPACGALAMRTVGTRAFGPMGASMKRDLKCQECGHGEQRVELAK